MAKKKTTTWFQLYKRIGRQPLAYTQNHKIIFKDKNGKETPLKLVFSLNGNSWWLEEDTND